MYKCFMTLLLLSASAGCFATPDICVNEELAKSFPAAVSITPRPVKYGWQSFGINVPVVYEGMQFEAAWLTASIDHKKVLSVPLRVLESDDRVVVFRFYADKNREQRYKLVVIYAPPDEGCGTQMHLSVRFAE